jgi:Phosphate transporter family
VIFGALMGAITWNVITWWLGIPSSSSHALIGGLVGAGIAKVGLSAIVWAGLSKTAAAIVLSPLIGFALALLLVLVVSWIFVRATPFSVDRQFRIYQFISASLYSLGHGGNDAQKTMGVIAVLLYSQGMLGQEFHVPLWVVLACQAAMALGTLFGGCGLSERWVRASPASRRCKGLCRDRRRGDAVPGDMAGCAGLDDPYHHRCDHRRRRGATTVGGALERHQRHRLRLDRDHSCGGYRRCGVLRTGPAVLVTSGFRQPEGYCSASYR